MRSSGPGRVNSGRPAPLACTECRLRHLKCDGQLPHCSRCLISNLPCQYLKSRRGGKRKYTAAVQSRSTTLEHTRLQLTQAQTTESDTPTQAVGSQSGSFSYPTTAPTRRIPSHSLSPASQKDDDAAAEMSLVKAYYQHFHRAHPILLAEESYAQRQYPNFLTAVVISIGAHFSTHTPAPSSGSSITRQLLAINEVSVWLVQARLLHSIALLGDGSLDEVRSLFVSARDLAIQLRMNRFDALETYASSFGDQELECLRRTWWELVILDGYMMAIWPELGYLTSTLDCDVPVPRDETDCVSSPLDHVPHAHAFCHDFHLNDDEEASLSSWWYRIQASSLLAKVVLLDTLETYNDKGQAMMASLASWRLSLPQDKAQFMDPYGRVNEMLFEAEMLAQVATIMLHFPRSDLSSDFRITTIVSSTAPRRPIRSCTKKVHGIKATEASKEISNLFSIYPSMEKCSPLLIPCLTLCGMVQLATYRSHAQFGNCLELHAERVRLLTGLLRSSGQIWGQAKTAYSEVKAAAADTFPFRKEGGQPSPVQMPSHTYHNASLSNSLALTQQESLLSMPIPSAMPDMSNWPWISDPMSQLLERNNAMQRADEYQLEL